MTCAFFVLLVALNVTRTNPPFEWSENLGAGHLNRKNALFAGHDEGGAAWGRLASLVETCKINIVEPFAYLKSTLEAIAAGHPKSRIDDLLPWNFQPSSYKPRALQQPLTYQFDWHDFACALSTA